MSHDLPSLEKQLAQLSPAKLSPDQHQRIRRGIAVGFVKIAFLTGIPFGLFFGLFMGLFFGWRLGLRWQFGLSLGLAGGLCAGILFGISMAAFARIQSKKMKSTDERLEGETILMQGPANHFLRGEGRGGWLTLTPSRLIFCSHGHNIQNSPLDIPLAEIREATPSLTMRIIPNGLRVNTKNGHRESFVVSNRKDWARRITEQLHS